MVGAKHTETPHDHLYYTNQLPEIPNTSYQKFNANYNKIICYKCINDVVVSVRRSRILGCLKGTSTNYEEIAQYCPAQAGDSDDGGGRGSGY